MLFEFKVLSFLLILISFLCILGLIAYPAAQDGSSVISFSPLLYTSYQQYIENLEFHLNGEYLITHCMGESFQDYS